MALVRPVLPWQSISSTRGTIHMWGGGGVAPVSLINVMCIPRQCLMLGQPGNGFLAGDQDSKWEGVLPNAPISSESFQPLDGMGVWPSLWRLAPDVQSSKLLDLVAIDITVVAMNLNSRLTYTNWVQRPLQEMEKPLGLCQPCLFHGALDSIYLPPMGSLASVGMLLTMEKVVTYLPKPPDFGNLRDGNEPSQLLLLNQTFRILPLCIKPTQGCQKCDRWHRDARWIGGLSHQSSDLSCLCYLLQKVVVHACSNARFEQHKVVNYPADLQTT